MAKLQLIVKGSLGEISFESFLTIMESSFGILRDLDSAVSRQPQGSLDWVIDRVFSGSIGMALESKPRNPQIDFGKQVVEVYSDGLEIIHKEGITPPYFSDNSLRLVGKVAKVLGKNGAKALQVLDVSREKYAEVEAKIVKTTSQLIGSSYESFGSIEGTLEMISIHKPARFNVYHSVSLRAVRCNLRKEDLENVRESLGRRVVVYGLISYNAKDEPKSVIVENLNVLPEENELPTIEEFVGSDPNFTGDIGTDEYIRSIRIG